MEKKYFVFVIQCYDEKTEAGVLIDYVEIQLIDDDMKKVISRAQKIIKKKYYRIATIIEKYKP